jgi:hypothetical protein
MHDESRGFVNKKSWPVRGTSFPLLGLGKQGKTPVMIAGIPAEICIEHILNTSQEPPLLGNIILQKSNIADRFVRGIILC